jgi:hypothetical protein
VLNLKPLLILAGLLLASVGVNLWQLRQSGKAKAACDARIAALNAAIITASIDRDTASVSVARETTAQAEETDAGISQTTNEAAARVQVITRTVSIPANCPTSLPDGVREEIHDAAARANRRM